MKNNLVKNNLLSYCAGSALFALLAFSASVAEAGIHLHGEMRMAPEGQVSLLYDSSGFPIWGYSACGRPIYAYSPAGMPIYVIRGIYRGCYVPAWNPRPHYHGTFWPVGVCRGRRSAHPQHGMAYPSPRPHCLPTAPGPLTADFRPISAADNSIYFLILFCTFETKKLIVNQKKMFDNCSFSLIVF